VQFQYEAMMLASQGPPSVSFFDFSVIDDYYFGSHKIAKENSVSGATNVF
jgi:hypothetical protein